MSIYLIVGFMAVVTLLYAAFVIMAIYTTKGESKHESDTN